MNVGSKKYSRRKLRAKPIQNNSPITMSVPSTPQGICNIIDKLKRKSDCNANFIKIATVMFRQIENNMKCSSIEECRSMITSLRLLMLPDFLRVEVRNCTIIFLKPSGVFTQFFVFVIKIANGSFSRKRAIRTT